MSIIAHFTVRFLAAIRHLPIWVVVFFISINLVFSPLSASKILAATRPSATEYQIKAGFLLKFLFLVQFPDNSRHKSNEGITIGIIGADPFGDAFQVIEGKLVNDQVLKIRRFKKNAKLDTLSQCDLIFISSSLGKNLPKFLETLNNAAILTVSETDGFLKMGGMINFIVDKGKIRFELNRRAAKKAGINFRSKLLRVAVEVVE